MRELHHIGIPTHKQQDNETHIENAKVFVTNCEASPNKIEWLRFEQGSPMPELIQTTAHIAYKVDNLEASLAGKDIIVEPFVPMDGVEVAFIVEEGAPIELMQIADK